MKKGIILSIFTFTVIAAIFSISVSSQSTPKVFSTAPAGYFIAGNTVELLCNDVNAAIYYTTDKSDPKLFGIEYNNPIKIDNSLTIKAVSKNADGSYGTVSEWKYNTVPVNECVIFGECKTIDFQRSITIDLKLDCSPGISSMSLKLRLDSEHFSLSETTFGCLFKETSVEKTGDSEYKLSLSSAEKEKNGLIATLELEVLSEDIPVGLYPVELYYAYGDITDSNGKAVLPYTVNGAVSVRSVLLGDVNRDGSVDNNDDELLESFVLGTDVIVDTSASDINKDGAVDIRDLLELRRILFGVDSSERNPSDADNAALCARISEASSGDVVYVDFVLENNPGLWGMCVEIEFPENALVPINVTGGSVFNSLPQLGKVTDSTFTVLLANDDPKITENNDGVIFTAAFTVSEGLDPKTAVPVIIKKNTVTDVSGNKIDIKSLAGYVAIGGARLPDVNGDRAITSEDLHIVLLAAVGADVSQYDVLLADFDLDGRITPYDVYRFLLFVSLSESVCDSATF